MAFTTAGSSSAWFENWSEDGTDITVPIATFPELTAAEADASTGDIRKIAFAIVDKLYQEYTALDSAERPTKMYIGKSSVIDPATGLVTNTYNIRFYNAVLSQDVDDET